MIINFIQDLATPHNNILLKELNQDKEINLNVWYCLERHPQYNWNTDLANEIKKASFYKSKKIDWNFISYCLKNKSEKYFIVGWMNPTTKLLILLLWISRRDFNIWFDYPYDKAKRSGIASILRNIYYFILKTSKAKIFCVGKMTIKYFNNRGFSEDRLVNLPIFVDISKTKKDYISKKEGIYKKYDIKNADLFLSAGSRLVYEKGYDLLIEAINNLHKDIKANLKCVIAGKGEEKYRLQSMIKKYKLEGNIFIEEWMEIADFKALIANSNVFIHPARFDAYGGGTLNSMVVGTPVIGTYQAGSAPDRVKDGINGFLYDCNDLKKLSELLEVLYFNKNKLEFLGKESRKTAEKWKPQNGKKIIKENLQ